jgi:16S rRNA (guanine527-N7)-methyltransferase
MQQNNLSNVQNFFEKNYGSEALKKLFDYEILLKKWAAKVNLVSQTTLKDIWTRHFLDSAQLISYLPQEKVNIVDMGSGAGFPGMIMALLTNHSVTLLESEEKKCIFLSEVKRLCNVTNVIILNKRFENISNLPADIITARGCASLPLLLTYAEPWILNSTQCLFLKGESYQNELSEAQKKWDFDCEILESLTHKESVILKLENIRLKKI